MVVVLIEEVTALDNLDDILKVDGIDVFFVAPTDLSQTMGHIGNVGTPRSAVGHRRRAWPALSARGGRPGRWSTTITWHPTWRRRALPHDLMERLGRPWRSRIPEPDTLAGSVRGGPESPPLFDSSALPRLTGWRWQSPAALARRRGRRPSPTGRRGNPTGYPPGC